MTQEAVSAAELAKTASSVGALFAQRARIDPKAIALFEGDKTRTFGELNDRVNRLANLLLEMGVSPGERVAMFSRNRMEYVEVELAAARIGAITACQNWRLADPELKHCLVLVEPKIVIVEPEYVDALNRVGMSQPRVVIGKDYEVRLEGASHTEPDIDVPPEAGFVILYTSGTTGMPKGALISHRAMIARSMVIASELVLPHDEAIVCWPPFFHMASTDQGIGAREPLLARAGREWRSSVLAHHLEDERAAEGSHPHAAQQQV